MNRIEVKHEFRDVSSFLATKLTGEEEYPVLGSLASEVEIREILRESRGLDRRRNCLEKAIRARRVLGRGLIVGGAVIILGKAGTYAGNAYDLAIDQSGGFLKGNDFHVWLQTDAGVVDVALPGFIELGVLAGVFKGREPFILAGMPPWWLCYFPRAAWTCVFNGDDVKLTQLVGSGDISPDRYRELVEEVMSGRFTQPRDRSGVYFLRDNSRERRNG